MISNNPNASVAVAAGAFTTLVVYVASLFDVTPPLEVASAFTTLVIAAVLFVGRHVAKPKEVTK